MIPSPLSSRPRATLPLDVFIVSAVPVTEVIDRLARLVDEKIPIGPVNFFGYPPVVEGDPGNRFALRLQRRRPGSPPQGFDSFRVMAVGSIAEREGETQVIAVIRLIGSRVLTAFKALVFGLLGLFLIAGLVISAAQRNGPDLGSMFVITVFILTFGGSVEIAWRIALRRAGSEAQLLADALRRAAEP